MQGVLLTGALLVPLTGQVNGVFHDAAWLSRAFETQQPAFGIALSPAAGLAKKFRRKTSNSPRRCVCPKAHNRGYRPRNVLTLC
jgi:hypothetical protein